MRLLPAPSGVHSPATSSSDFDPNCSGVRLTITLSLTTLELVGRAAKLVGVSEPLFLIGSALAYVGRLQRRFQGTHVDPPELAGVIREELREISLPSQYRYRERRTGLRP
jgi:hypothetical protein